MEDTFLRKYYSIGKTSAVRRAIHEFSQGPGEVFYEAWERLRDLLRQCAHHGIPKHEINQTFYDGLGAPDRCLLDAASGDTFMIKYEDEALELIELVAQNSHHHVAKSFGGRSARAKGGMLDAKAVRQVCFWIKLKSWPRHKIWLWILLRSDQVLMASHQYHMAMSLPPCSHCSSFEHVELDCPMIAI